MLEGPESETPFILLTQDDCPRCERLKLMLEQPLRGKYQDVITVVRRQGEPERFRELAEAYGLKSTPVIIERSSGTVFSKVASLAEVKAFLDKEARAV